VIHSTVPPHPPLSKKLETILVVDDTPAILIVVVAILKRANSNVVTARSGAEANQHCDEA